MECYTGMKCVKREYSLPQVINLSLPKCFWGSFVKRTKNSSENSHPFWRLDFRRQLIVRPLSSGEGLRDLHYIMSMVLDTRFRIWFIATVCYKMRQILLQNTTAILLQNTTSLLQNASGLLLQNAAVLLQNATFITNCHSTYRKNWMLIILHFQVFLNFRAYLKEIMCYLQVFHKMSSNTVITALFSNKFLSVWQNIFCILPLRHAELSMLNLVWI